MNKYEIMIVTKIISDEELNAIIEKSKSIINAEGKVDKVDIWGEKALAYEILGSTRGIYALITYSSTSNATKELDRYLKINETILRHMIVRKEC